MVTPRAPTSRKTMEKLGHRRRAQAEKKSWPSANMVNGAPAARLCYQAAQQVVMLEEKPAEPGRAAPPQQYWRIEEYVARRGPRRQHATGSRHHGGARAALGRARGHDGVGQVINRPPRGAAPWRSIRRRRRGDRKGSRHVHQRYLRHPRGG